MKEVPTASEHGQTLVLVTVVGISALVLYLVRRRRIAERFSMLWLGISLLLLIASSVGYPYLFKIAAFIGVPYPPSALFFLAISGIILLLIELFAWISKLNDRTTILGQQVAILTERLLRYRAQSLQKEETYPPDKQD